MENEDIEGLLHMYDPKSINPVQQVRVYPNEPLSMSKQEIDL